MSTTVIDLDMRQYLQTLRDQGFTLSMVPVKESKRLDEKWLTLRGAVAFFSFISADEKEKRYADRTSIVVAGMNVFHAGKMLKGGRVWEATKFGPFKDNLPADLDLPDDV